MAELDDGDVDEEEVRAVKETDEDREAADDAVIDGLDDELPELVLTRDEITAGQLALEKVCIYITVGCAVRDSSPRSGCIIGPEAFA